MANMITVSVIPGASVYGVDQVEYTVSGSSGRDFSAALTAAAFKQSVAIESAASAYSVAIRPRLQKLDELGQVLACLNTAYAKLPVKDQSQSDSASVDNSAWVNATALKYGITLVFKENSNAMLRGNVMKGQNDVQYVIDVENNNMQQAMVGLQSMISKRDNAYSSAAKLVRKADEAASKVIGNMG